VRETLDTFDSHGSVDHLEQITNLIGIRRSRERYDLIREWLALKVEDNDFTSYQAKFKRIEAKIKSLDITASLNVRPEHTQNLEQH
jgi:hypothetical protein